MGTIQRQQELSSGQRSEPSEKVLNVAVWGRELRHSAGITVIFPCLLLFAIHIGRLRADRRRGLQGEFDHDHGAGGRHGAPCRGRPPPARDVYAVSEEQQLGNKRLLALQSPVALSPRLCPGCCGAVRRAYCLLICCSVACMLFTWLPRPSNRLTVGDMSLCESCVSCVPLAGKAWLGEQATRCTWTRSRSQRSGC